MKKKKKILLSVAAVSICLLFAGCGSNAEAVDTDTTVVEETTDTQEATETEETMATETSASISTEVGELYQSQNLMLEMLVNENCVIEDTGDTITVMAPDGFACVNISFVPGIQNLGKTATMIPEVLKENGAVPGEVEEGVLFGARANHCSYTFSGENGSESYGIFAASIINSSLYMANVVFAPGCNDADAELIINVFSSINVLSPVSVDTETKTATYETKYPTVTPAKAVQKTYVPVVEWVYPPYYYYDWYSDFDYSIYDASYYEPDWDYYLDGAWWSWDWDEDGHWGFYDEYGYWYEEDYYDYYDYYYDYDPYSDPGDYYDYGDVN